MIRLRLFLALVAILGSPKVHAADPPHDAAYYNKLLGRAVNFGNTLDAPHEGEWGITLQERYFDEVKKAGFQAIRLPVRWDTHASGTAPFTIEPSYLARVEWAIDHALNRGLVIIVNVHHDGSINENPEAQLPRIEAYWRQIATRFRDKSDHLYFELLNEPHDKFTDERWQAAFPKLLAAIRESNPDRIVIVGPAGWNGIDHLGKLELPKSDKMLIATFHDYNPFKFTHQGASWVQGSTAWKGTTWTGTPEERAAIDRDFAKVAAWSKKHGRPIFLGEFGAFGEADMASRVRWTEAMTRKAEAHGFSWAYWEFASGFGVYDPAKNEWREPLLEAMVPQKKK